MFIHVYACMYVIFACSEMALILKQRVFAVYAIALQKSGEGNEIGACGPGNGPRNIIVEAQSSNGAIRSSTFLSVHLDSSSLVIAHE